MNRRKIDLSVLAKLREDRVPLRKLALVFGCSVRAISKALCNLDAEPNTRGPQSGYAAAQTPETERLPLWIATLDCPCKFSERGFVLRGQVIAAKERPNKHFEEFHGKLEPVKKPIRYEAAIEVHNPETESQRMVARARGRLGR